MLEGKEGDKNLILHCDASTDTVMPCSMMGIHSIRSEKFVVRQFCCANTIECTYTNIVQPTTHLDYVAYPIAPRLQACIACYCMKQHRIKSRTRKNDAIK